MMDKTISYEDNDEYNCGMVKTTDVVLSDSSSISLLDLPNAADVVLSTFQNLCLG